MTAVVDITKCKGCPFCVDECPDQAIWIEDGHAMVADSLCEDCGECAYVCPEKAITIPSEL